jgi:hypothetical protein
VTERVAQRFETLDVTDLAEWVVGNHERNHSRKIRCSHRRGASAWLAGAPRDRALPSGERLAPLLVRERALAIGALGVTESLERCRGGRVTRRRALVGIGQVEVVRRRNVTAREVARRHAAQTACSTTRRAFTPRAQATDSPLLSVMRMSSAMCTCASGAGATRRSRS